MGLLITRILVTVANLQSYVGEDHYLAAKDWATWRQTGFDSEVAVVDMEEKGKEIKELQSALLG